MAIPKLIIHGGAGSALRDPSRGDAIRASLSRIVGDVYARLVAGMSATEAVIEGCAMLEDDPLFNAGTGSVIQGDGQIRMSAALMDGAEQRFSGVINVSRVQNPIRIAGVLQEYPDRVLSDGGAGEFARFLKVPVYDPLVERRLHEWIAERKRDETRAAADVVALDQDSDKGKGTIGVVAMDAMGRLAAGTSTGGRGFEHIGRVSDSGMPAGNYATQRAAVSCTGIGEHIVDECLAARLVVRVTDGMSLLEAFERSFGEAEQRGRVFGAIGIDASGAVAWGKTSDLLLAAYHDGVEAGDTLELAPGRVVGVAKG